MGLQVGGHPHTGQHVLATRAQVERPHQVSLDIIIIIISDNVVLITCMTLVYRFLALASCTILSEMSSPIMLVNPCSEEAQDIISLIIGYPGTQGLRHQTVSTANIQDVGCLTVGNILVNFVGNKLRNKGVNILVSYVLSSPQDNCTPRL